MVLRDQLAAGIGTEADYIDSLAHTADQHYRISQIDKRSGGKRTIWSPSQELKAAQRWLVRNVISKLPVHAAAVAYEPGSSIRKNASQHVQSKYLLRMDFRLFFESIDTQDVLTFLDSRKQYLPSDWTSNDSTLLASLCSWRGQLVIGSVGSPSLTNRICFALDQKIEGLCEGRKVRYTRYADDLFFSTSTKNILCEVEKEVIKIVGELDCPRALSLNNKKTQHSSKKRRRTVTGLVLSSQGTISIGRDKKRRISAMIHQFKNLDDEERAWLRGTLAFCRDVEASFVNRLIIKYGPAHMDSILSK